MMLATPEKRMGAPQAAATDFAVEARSVHKSFQRGTSVTPVLKGVDLHIRRGECVFLLGPSGSGKTTLLSIIGCLLTPDDGAVRVLGEEPRRMAVSDRAALRRQQIGFVFQRFHLIRGLTSAENVAAPLRLDGHDNAFARRRALDLLDQVGLADKANESPARMSVGQCQRVAVARALVADPELVLADEPTASLDAEAGHNAMRLLRRLTVEAGKTLVVVTHDQRIVPEEPNAVDRVVAIDSGRIVEPHAPSKSKHP